MRPSLRNESNDADVADQKLCCRDRLSYLTGVVGAEGVAAIEPIYSKQAVADGTTLTLGGTGIEPSHAGAAHAPGDILAQLPKQQTILVWALLLAQRVFEGSAWESSSHPCPQSCATRGRSVSRRSCGYS